VPPATVLGGGAGTGAGTGAKGAAGGAGAPATSGPGAPTGGSANSSTSPGAATANSGAGVRGAPLDDDLTRWEYWWEFGKDPFLRLRDVVEGGRRIVGAEDALLNPRFHHRRGSIERPTDHDLQLAADRLVAALRKAEDRDTVSACLVALAKIGRDGATWTLTDVLQPYLARNDQEQRETAALALGIAKRGDAATIDLLCQLARDTDEGRRQGGNRAVNERTRAFATYGLGLQLQVLQQPALAFRLVGVLRQLVTDRTLGWNLRVAAIEALGQFPTAWQSAAADALRESIVTDLGAFFLAPAGPGEQIVQAHVPPVIGRLLGSDHRATALWRDRFAAELARGLTTAASPDGQTKSNTHIAQSCALALGSLCRPWTDPRDADATACDLLLRVHRRHRDQQTRSFAILALARIGGPLARDAILAEFGAAGAAIELPWCAMALGVWTARNIQDASVAGAGVGPDRRVQEALQQAFAKARTPAAIGALGLALGLAQEATAGSALRSALAEHAHRDDLAGYLALGLGLMGDHDATGEIRALVAAADRRPQVLSQAVRALGLLGDHGIVADLCRRLAEPDPSLVRLSALAAALGQIGDRRSLQPLLAMLEDQRLTPLTRAFAAVAVGLVGDKDPLPWNAAYASTTNYRAATETLTDGASGILDIL
jgi:HEAT repeat protein